VEEQVGGIILDLGYTRTKNSTFFRTLDLYWHTNTMVALGMFPKDQHFRQLKQRMESLEEKNNPLMNMVQWLVKFHGGSFYCPTRGRLHSRSSLAMDSMEQL
jgi:hypothetical protein